MRGVTGDLRNIKEVDSSNNYAMALVRKGEAGHGDAILAQNQIAGKGRRGKVWESVPGESLLLSVIADMSWTVGFNPFPISVATALAVHRTVTLLSDEKYYLKWPNDIYVDDRKAGGILIENVVSGKIWQWAVVGIGINVNQPSFGTHLSNATSLRIVSGREHDVKSLANALRLSVLQEIESLKTGNYGDMLEAYNSVLYKRGQKVKLKKGPIVFESTIHSVTPTGELLTRDAIERTHSFDEIEWLL